MPDETATKTCSFDVCCECKLGCCQDAKPPLTTERKRIIQDHLKQPGTSMAFPFDHAGYSFPTVDKMGFCVFYNKKTKQCQIHAVKPETCRAGPITFDINRDTRKVEWFLKTPKICALAGLLSEDDIQLREHLNVAKEEILKLICGLDSEALRTILKIAEPDTFKIGEDNLPKEVLGKLDIE